MTYKTSGSGYVFWNNVIVLPMKRKPGEKQRYFRKEIPFEEADKYWEWDVKGHSIYYVTKGKNRGLARANVPEDWKPEAVMAQIHDKDIEANDCRRVEEYKGRVCGPRVACTNNYSTEFDGKSVLAIMVIRPKMSYAEVLMVIKAEGGYVDENGIVRKGTAQNKLWVVNS